MYLLQPESSGSLALSLLPSWESGKIDPAPVGKGWYTDITMDPRSNLPVASLNYVDVAAGASHRVLGAGEQFLAQIGAGQALGGATRAAREGTAAEASTAASERGRTRSNKMSASSAAARASCASPMVRLTGTRMRRCESMAQAWRQCAWKSP